MDNPSTPPHPETRGTLAGRVATSLTATLSILLLVAPLASAQTLPELLPEDVVLAVGVQGLAQERERIQPFLDEAERLGLVDSVGGAVPDDVAQGAAEEADLPEVPEALADLGPLDLIGEDAWLVVSASAFRPLPAVTVVARPSDAATEAFRSLIEDAEGEPGVERREEGGRTLWTYVPPADATDAFDLPLAYAQSEEGVAVVSTDPEIVRFVLRALDGAGEPSLADTETFAALRDLGDGVAFGILEPAPLARALEPLAAGFEAGPLLARIRDALATAGPSVGLVRVTDDGIESRSVQRPLEDGPDPMLYALLTEGAAAGTEVLAFAPEDAVAVSASTFDVAGWWAWLDDVLSSARSLGLPSASELAGMVGIDPGPTLLDWTDDGFVQVVLPMADAAPAGAPQESLANQVFLLEARDEEAARQGIGRLLATLGPTVSAFASPSGQEMTVPETVTVAGHEVQRLTLPGSLSLDAAVVDGWALFTTSPEATESVLGAYAADAEPPAALAEAAAALDGPVRAWTLSDDRAAILGASEALVGQLQLFAGLGGAGQLDFESVDEASSDLEAFLAFVGERVGTSRSVTTVEDGTLRTRGLTRVDW